MAVLLTGLVVLAPGCDDDDDDTPPPEERPEEGARLRVIHASPDAPAVDLYAAGSTTPLVTNVAYGTATQYLTLEPGEVAVDIRPAGAPPEFPPVFTTGTLTLSAGEQVTVIAAGLLNEDDADETFRLLALREGFGEDQAGQARVRIVHASPDAPTVGIDVGNDGSVEVDSLERFADTGETGVLLPAGTALQVGITTGAGDTPVTAFTVPALPEGAEVFVVATGLLERKPREEQGFVLLPAGPEGALGLVRQNPVVYALHASPDAPEVDIFSGDTQVAGDLSFGELSGPIQVPPGTYTLDFFAAASGDDRPSGAPAASSGTPELAAGERYLVVASGFLAPEAGVPGFTLLPFAEAFLEDPVSAKVRVVHAAPGAPPVDAGPLAQDGTVPADAPVSNLAFSQATVPAGVSLPPGTVTLGVVPTGAEDRAPIARFRVDATPFVGKGVFAVAAGALAPEDDQPGFQLLVVDTSEMPWEVSPVRPQP
ncbi:DUF4397 domain-containing protein [Pyxidicoccus fallax]|uniref:DUF4397 domain-containing protein n=1 Tax=Pyxidicoccus fallax TaxID=394095 RepID=A0A848LL03_9BACT|nr:DUF4397 domain-containing protein [Pyxidicoccus fallax]NMO18408.1 DUF4397 domain-containing protein [Pyxidicoccus fallax]NPC78922.1 DUF4397 domain-containing protein [Pyxidicoccus fallax]